MSTVRIRLPDPPAIAEAVTRLNEGDLVVLPTETVYGLGGSTTDPRALARIFDLKGRPANNPLIAHVLDEEQAHGLVHGWDDRCELLAERFWPGPLTLILPRAREVPDLASGGRHTLAVRSPTHPVAREVLKEFGAPISAPSANRSGLLSPTCAMHVAEDYEGHGPAKDLLVLDGGSCSLGIESTILDLSTPQARLLRPGSISMDELSDAIGSLEMSSPSFQVHAPGTSPSHYAPRTKMKVLDRESIVAMASSRPGDCAILLLSPIQGDFIHLDNILDLESDPAVYAEGLYAALRALDGAGVELLLVERPPEGPEWQAVHDRLQRGSLDVSTIKSAGGGSSGGSP